MRKTPSGGANSKDPVKRARSLANLRHTTEEERAKGHETLRAISIIRGSSSPFRLDEVDWEEHYVTKAFEEERWQAFYRETKAALLKQYVLSDEAGYAQYRILVENITTLHVLVARATAHRDMSETVQMWRDQLRAYIGQLQKYTEAEKRIDFIVEEKVGVALFDERVRLVDRLAAVVERMVPDAATRRDVFNGWKTILQEREVVTVSANGVVHEDEDDP